MTLVNTSQLAEIAAAYSATKLTFFGAGADNPLGADGPGGGLVAAVERRGVVPIAAHLAPGERMLLADTGVTLELRRVPDGVRLRVEWDGGPAYVDHVPFAASATPLPLQSSSAKTLDMPAAEPAVAVIASAAVATDITPETLGSPRFRAVHDVNCCYVQGAMAGGIASASMVTAMAQAGLLGFFGAGGLPLEVVDSAIGEIVAAVDGRPFGANLLHNPMEPAVEEKTVDIYLHHGVSTVSASAFMQLTPAIVRYRLAGIHQGPNGEIVTPHRIFAKVSRPEVAAQFMRPAPKRIVEQLVESGVLSKTEAAWAAKVPMAEDITAEADSGGHTDRRPLSVLLPTLLRLRDQICEEESYSEGVQAIRVGAAGGLGEPTAMWGAFAMGADYVLTGSVNQATSEAGTSELAKEMLMASGMADCATGPAPDMFEIGAHVQVLGRGSMYAQRAERLYRAYKSCDSIADIPGPEKAKIEKTIFKMSFEEVWSITEAYWSDRDPAEVARAEKDGKHKMALCFRWYLGMTSRWARTGEKTRKRDFQIWCGPSMGAFNDWVKGSWLEPLEARDVVSVAHALMDGVAALGNAHAAGQSAVSAVPPRR